MFFNMTLKYQVKWLNIISYKLCDYKNFIISILTIIFKFIHKTYLNCFQRIWNSYAWWGFDTSSEESVIFRLKQKFMHNKKLNQYRENR